MTSKKASGLGFPPAHWAHNSCADHWGINAQLAPEVLNLEDGPAPALAQPAIASARRARLAEPSHVPRFAAAQLAPGAAFHAVVCVRLVCRRVVLHRDAAADVGAIVLFTW